MLEQFLLTLLKEFDSFCTERKHNDAQSSWFYERTLQLLKQYPAGISKTVLLTELEYQWRVRAKRGEHAGKLKQVVSSMQLSLSDVLIADITKLDEYRCQLSAGDTQCTLIVHRQWFDWTMYLGSAGVDALTGRRCALTQCRLLKLAPPVLLPTAIAIFLLRLADPHEAFVAQDVFGVLYAAFWDKYVLPCASYVAPASGSAADRLADSLAVMALQPDNAETIALFAEVLGCGEARGYGDQHAAGAAAAQGSTAEYRLVTLRLSVPSQQLEEQEGPGHKAAKALLPVVAYMILFDEQEALCRLWQTGDQLLIYRPYLRGNAEESFIFGSGRHSTSNNNHPGHTMLYEVSHPAQLGLLDFVPLEANFAPFHLLYGSVTVVAKVLAPAAASTEEWLVQEPARSLTAGAALPATRDFPLTSALVRVLSVRLLLASGAGGEPRVELWGETKSEARQCRRLLCLRTSRSRFNEVCGSVAQAALSFSTPASVELLLAGEDGGASPMLSCAPSVRPGQVARLSGLQTLRCEVVGSRAQAAASGLDVPATVLEYLQGVWPSSASSAAVEMLSCCWGGPLADIDIASDMFPEHSNNSTVLKKLNSSQSCITAGLWNLSTLTALACSPSLVQPVSLSAALALRSSVAAGCVLVYASSIQPMHPSVRVCEDASEGQGQTGGVGNDVGTQTQSVLGQKRPVSVPPVDALTPLRARWGYQIMRLRDGSGEALCLVESVVALGPAGVLRVRQHLVNTCSTLFFDPATGQLTRLTSSCATVGLAVLLSRVDDGVDCPVLRQLRARRGENQSAAPGALPVFRIEAICDANPAGMAAFRSGTAVVPS